MRHIILLLAALLPAWALAQRLEIRVLSQNDGTPVSGKTVFLTQISQNLARTAVTGDDGVAAFGQLAYDTPYLVYTEDDEVYQFGSLSGIRIRRDGRSRFDLLLRRQEERALGEILIYSAPMARINTENATVSGQIRKAELQAMPIEGRDITRSLFRLPNVTVAVLGYAEGPNISINGLNGIFTNYLVDGMDNNERFLGNMKLNTPVGFVENVTVLTNNYSAEWGNTSNGIVNVLTRSGTNQVSGEVFYLTRPGSVIDAPSSFATLDLSGNPVKDGFMRHQTGFSVGGPIRKDKTFFYVNAEQTFDQKDNLLNSPLLGVNETVRGFNRFTYLSGKLDHYWSRKWHTSLRGQLGRMYIDRQGGGLEGGTLFPSAASAQKNETHLIALRNEFRLSSRFSGELNYQHNFFRWNYREPINAGTPSVTVQAPTGAVIATVGQSGAIFDDFEYTHQVQAKGFYQLGTHRFKGGFEFITSDFSLLGGGNPFGTYTIRLTEAQLDSVRALNLGAALNVEHFPRNAEVRTYDVELRPSAFGARQNVTSAYLEDQWSLSPRLSLNLGIRWDYDNLSRGGGTRGDFNNLAPRTSFNFKLSERTVIRGGYGIAYDKIKYSVYSDNLQFSSSSADFKAQLAELQRLGLLDPEADLERITFEGNLRATAPNVSYLNGPTPAELQERRDQVFSTNLRIMNPNGFQNPYSHQFAVGFQTKPAEDRIFIFDAVHTRTNNLFLIRNLNAPSPYPFTSTDPKQVTVRTRAQADATRPVPIFSDARGFYSVVGGDTLRGGSRNVFVTETDGIARYTALNFMFQKEMGEQPIGYRLLYTLSWTKSNTSSINTRAQDSNDYEAEYAWDENDRRHVMSGVILYQPFSGLTLAPTFLIQSGQPVTRVADATVFGTTDLNGDGESFGLPADRWPGEPKNSDRLPWATTFDVSAKYQLALAGSLRLELSADVFNVFNAQNWSGYNTTRSVSNQAQIGPKSSNTYRLYSASPPRQFQFGARFVF
ncbi:MAG: TonB-dependent receptor [Bacteroidia bacterium]|nr:TonB-dependent receptor [Bacteroidia bacterium]